MLICQAALPFAPFASLFPTAQPAFAEEEPAPAADQGSENSAKSPSEAQKTAISTHCVAIKDTLKKLQKDDSHARVYLGGRYEKILSKYAIPLNTRLVENSLSTPELIETQNQLAKAKSTFVSDFIDYQRNLENLVSIDCASNPDKFYQELLTVRTKRQTVAKDIDKLHSLAASHLKQVTTLKDKI